MFFTSKNKYPNVKRYVFKMYVENLRFTDSYTINIYRMIIGTSSKPDLRHCPKVSTTPITAIGCQQCLPPSVFQLKDKHCRKPYCRNWAVDTFGHC